MHAQGLQTERALPNIVLGPANSQPYKNKDAALGAARLLCALRQMPASQRL